MTTTTQDGIACTFARELMNAAAVVKEKSLDSIVYATAYARMTTAAQVISLMTGTPTSDLIEEAEVRARKIIQNEDWRREFQLYDTLWNYAS